MIRVAEDRVRPGRMEQPLSPRDVQMRAWLESAGSWVWWHMPVSPAVGWLRQEDCYEF